MRGTVQRLRRAIVAAAALLIAVVLGFFFYGRYRYQHFERDLPGRLGANIQQTANGFSYTQSSEGHALFTLKASKEMQMKSGHVLLHNVDITLYGPPGSGRTDHIFGSDFDYDQDHGIATSHGDVEIELQGTSQSANGTQATGAATIRVRTSGLTFLQKTGEASTERPVEFQLPRGAGTSVGAYYNSKTGQMVLSSQVHITTSSNGRPAQIEAAKATLERETLEGFLVHPVLQFETESGSADAATVYLRKDGTTERVDAQGNVRMRNDSGATVDAATARILLDARSQPVHADLGGGVTFASARPGQIMRGSAGNGTLDFAGYRTAKGGMMTALRHADFRQDAHLVEESTGLGSDGCGSMERTMRGQRLRLYFGRSLAGNPPQAQTAVAEGNPVMTMVQASARGPAQTTRIRGDRLVANLGPGNRLRMLDGTGHTEIDQFATDGSRNVSRGDMLHATFVEQPASPRKAIASGPGATGHGCVAANAPAKKKKANSGSRMETVLDKAMQDGDVTLTEVAARKEGAAAEPATLQAWAQHSEYSAADQVLHLSGHPRITDGATMQMAADEIEFHRDTQDAAARGDVKATYTQAAGTADRPGAPAMGGNGPVHIIAERAAMDHANNQTTFYGTAQTPARMWQDTDSLLAPAISIDRNRNVLRAWGEGDARPEVNANFTTAMGAQRAPSVVRVRSETLMYSDQARRADFHGSVMMAQADGVLRCSDTRLFLKPAAEKGKAAPATRAGAGKGNTQIDHLVATGHVVFAQPGRRGQGTRLVYTVDGGQYVLTGTAGAPPTLWDEVHGTTTGAELRFSADNGTVQVLGGRGGAVTNTTAPK